MSKKICFAFDHSSSKRDWASVLAIDRDADDVVNAVRRHTNEEGVRAVFDPIGAATFQASLQLLAPRGCLINYGELSGPVPPIDLNQLFPRSLFVTKYNGTRWAEGPQEFAHLIEHALDTATKRPAVISEIAGPFPARAGGRCVLRAREESSRQDPRASVIESSRFLVNKT